MSKWRSMGENKTGDWRWKTAERPGAGDSLHMSKLYKFQNLHVYQLALDHIDAIYSLTEQLPNEERYNLISQMRRAATSVALNIAFRATADLPF